MVPLQKNAQLSSDTLREMMEVACLWEWILPTLKTTFGSGECLDRIVESWKMGLLNSNAGYCCENAWWSGLTAWFLIMSCLSYFRVDQCLCVSSCVSCWFAYQSLFPSLGILPAPLQNGREKDVFLGDALGSSRIH